MMENAVHEAMKRDDRQKIRGELEVGTIVLDIGCQQLAAGILQK